MNERLYRWLYMLILFIWIVIGWQAVMAANRFIDKVQDIKIEHHMKY